ncbi:MAG: type II toxin-antitoxin system PemK/MazF family toxin [Rhodoglobus sp.]
MSVIIQRGQIWNAMVPFNDDKSGKFRPSVILGWSPLLSGDDHNLLVVPITSFGDGGTPKTGDFALNDYTALGLKEGSHVRTRRLMTLHPRAFNFSDGPFGTLEASDLSSVLLEIERLFAVPGMATVPRF